MRPYFLATSAAGTPRWPRRLVCKLRRSRRATVERRVRPLSGSLSISVNFRSTASSTTSRSSSTVSRAKVFIWLRPPANRLAWTTPLRARPLPHGGFLPHAPQCCGSITQGFFLRQGQTCVSGFVPCAAQYSEPSGISSVRPDSLRAASCPLPALSLSKGRLPARLHAMPFALRVSVSPSGPEALHGRRPILRFPDSAFRTPHSAFREAASWALHLELCALRLTPESSPWSVVSGLVVL